jgi:hypothetical protein
VLSVFNTFCVHNVSFTFQISTIPYHAFDETTEILFRIEFHHAANQQSRWWSTCVVRDGLVDQFDLVLGQCLPAVARVVQQRQTGRQRVTWREVKRIGLRGARVLLSPHCMVWIEHAQLDDDVIECGAVVEHEMKPMRIHADQVQMRLERHLCCH